MDIYARPELRQNSAAEPEQAEEAARASCATTPLEEGWAHPWRAGNGGYCCAYRGRALYPAVPGLPAQGGADRSDQPAATAAGRGAGHGRRESRGRYVRPEFAADWRAAGEEPLDQVGPGQALV